MPLKLWLREETKKFERRTALTPAHAKELIELGVEVTVEESPDRIFTNQLYRDIGCNIVAAYSWKNAPKDQTILGLKEIEVDDHDFCHNHIYFAHVFKGQPDAAKVLGSYKKGGGKLFDLEFLTNSSGRRVAAFGRWAGFVGAALSLDRYWQRELDPNSSYPNLKSFEDINGLLKPIEEKASQATRKPKVIIIGAKGRCGSGAHEVFKHFNIDCTLWDYEETKVGGPFSEITEHDIFINTVLLSKKIAPFIDRETIKNGSQLKIVGDVSCDPESEFNPVAIYNQHTSWSKAFLRLEESNTEVLAVDNLPSILPKESSEDFSEQLIPFLKELHNFDATPEVFQNAFDVFERKMKEVLN